MPQGRWQHWEQIVGDPDMINVASPTYEGWYCICEECRAAHRVINLLRALRLFDLIASRSAAEHP